MTKLGQTSLQLLLYQARVGEQRTHLLPDQGIDFISPHRTHAADATVFEPPSIRADASVVVELACAGLSRRSIKRIATTLARDQSLQQRRHLGIACREAFVVLKPARSCREGLFTDDGRHRDLYPFLVRSLTMPRVPSDGTTLQSYPPSDRGAMVRDHCLGKTGPAHVGRIAKNAPHGGTVPALLARGCGNSLRTQPSCQVAYGVLLFDIAAIDLTNSRSLRFGDLVASLGVLALAYVAVAVRGATQDVDRTGPRPMRLASARPFGNLRPFVLGDHALKLNQQSVLRAVRLGTLEKSNLGACSRELFNQQSLVCVLAGESVWGVAKENVNADLGGQVAQALQCRPDQGRARVALIFEDPVARNFKSLCGGVLQQRRRLTRDGSFLALLGRRDACVDSGDCHRLSPVASGYCSVRGQESGRPGRERSRPGGRRRSRAQPVFWPPLGPARTRPRNSSRAWATSELIVRPLP